MIRYRLVPAILLTLVLALFAGAQNCPDGRCPLPSPQQPAPGQSPHKSGYESSVVILRCSGGSMGSGTIVAVQAGQALILTAAHVVKGGQPVAYFRDKSAAGRVLAADPKTDLAAVLVPSSICQGAAICRVGETEPAAGVTVWKVGYPAGQLDTRYGAVASYNTNNMFVTVLVSPGDSGGGMFRDARLLGVISAYIVGQRQTAVAVRLTVIQRFMAAQCCDWFRRSPQPQPMPPQPWGTQPPPAPSEQDPEVGRLRGALDGLKSKLDSMPPEERIQRIERAVGLLSWLLPLVGFGAGVPLVNMLWGAVKPVLSRRSAGQPGVDTGTIKDLIALLRGGGPADQAPSTTTTATAPASESATVVVSAEPQTVVRTESRYVEVDRPNAELQALKDAMDEYVRRNPGSVAAVEAIKAFAAQIQSGMK